MSEATDWSAWSREAVALMQARNEAWIDRYGLANAPFTWNIDDRTLRFSRPDGDVVADLCLVGATAGSRGTFLWAWADGGVPKHAWERLHAVIGFGQEHDLGLLTTPEWPGGRSEGLEMVAVAGRILDAEGAFVDTRDDVTIFFLLFDFREERPSS
ncbi:MAG: hypothetical protein K0S86_842 [Geminicoccaceae bacterium]|nr:hypothetical protein [Geminicoccaceae bacterium]